MEKLPVYIMNKSMPEDKTGVFLAGDRDSSLGYSNFLLLASIVVTGIMWVMVIMVMGG